MMLKKLYTERGQVALIVLVMSAVVLTIGLATTARTVTDIKISSQLEESGKALSAAEAGVELALQSGTSGTWSAGDGVSSGSYEVCEIGRASANCPRDYSLGLVKKGEARTIWLVPHDTNSNPQLSGPYYTGRLDVTWRSSSLETIIVYKQGGNYKIERGFETVAGTKGFDFSSGGKDEILLRVRPISKETTITVSGMGSSFPSQGKKIVSTGSTTTNVTRKVEVTKWYPEIPGIMDYVMYSEGDLIK